MDTQSILGELTAERDRLTAAIEALSGNGSTRTRTYSDGRGRRRLSAAAKKAIGDKMKEVWAKRKRAAKNK